MVERWDDSVPSRTTTLLMVRIEITQLAKKGERFYIVLVLE